MAQKGKKKISSKVEIKCATCGKPILVYPCRLRTGHNKYCSKECRSKGWSSIRKTRVGPKAPLWKGGRILNNHGYWEIQRTGLSPEDNALVPGKRAAILEHRLLVARYLGRPLKPYEIIHHINGNPSDNRLENLELITSIKGNSHYNQHPFIKCPKCGHQFPALAFRIPKGFM